MRVYAVKKILQSTPLCYNKPYNKKSGNNRVFPSGHNIRRHPKENAMRANNLTLLTDLYELTMMQGYFKNPTNQTVVFDMFYRNNPCDGGFAICAGLEQMIEYIENLRFSEEDITYLRSLGIFEDDFLEYLSNFRFTGDIYAIPEGTVIFPREPMVKVIAPIMEAQLVETAILNI